MNCAKVVRESRRRAGLSQRELAKRSGVPQPAIARLESGRVIPGAGMLDRLLRACGAVLEPMPRPGAGVDRSGMIENLQLTPEQRLRRAAADWEGLKEFLEKAKVD